DRRPCRSMMREILYSRHLSKFSCSAPVLGLLETHRMYSVAQAKRSLRVIDRHGGLSHYFFKLN
ncbi:MAG TPA: hypothetical protein VGH29_16345, partial [Candidatus Binataceae bacterium]